MLRTREQLPADYRQMKMLPVSFDRQVIPGRFEYTLNYLIDEKIDLSVFAARYKNDENGAPAYALSAFRFKVASSASDLRINEPDATTLVGDGKPKAGSFRVVAGEIVYVGYFGVDCSSEPTPWRFYIEDAKTFEKYSSELHREFPSTQSVPVMYWLFATDTLGTPYSLPASESGSSRPNKTMELTR